MLRKLLDFLTANLVTKLISVAIALLLWVIVLGSRNVEVTKEIPIEINTSSDVVPANEIPEKIAFRLSGPKAFLRAIVDRHEDPIRVNLSGAKPGLVTYRFFSDNIKIPIGVKVLSVSPAAILIKLEAIKKREVPVKVELRGVPPEGFRIGKLELKPEVIRIKGPESRIENITQILANPIDVSHFKESVEKEVGLDLARLGVQLEGPLPKISIGIEPVTANFRIRNVDVRVISSGRVRLDEKTVTVMVQAEAKEMKFLDRSRVYAVIDMSDKPKGQYFEAVKVILPEGVGLVRVIPDRIGVTLY
ncbi:CdaR family protein [Bdellovibrionota bacterium FG-2]